MKQNPYSDMDQPAYRVAYLIAGFIKNTLTEKEHDELDDWVNESDENMKLFEDLTDEDNVKSNLEWMEQVQTERAYSELKDKIKIDKKRKKIIPSSFWFAAASVLVLIGLAFFLRYLSDKKSQIAEDKKTILKDSDTIIKAPVLTLADGSTVNLSTADTGLLKTNDGTSVSSTSGQLVYEKNNGSPAQGSHTLTIPPGMVYMLQLPDGSKVWLNASSTLKYPVQFSNTERRVEINGEAYFEVAKNDKQSFLVTLSNGAIVRVLGTHFNVDAYPNEKENLVTLLEGSVAVAKSGDVKKLEPGTQASISENGMQKKSITNLESVLGWKNGLFVFNDSPIELIMQELEQWYGIKTIYQGNIRHRFNANISRKEPVEKILHLLELNGYVHFKKENNTIYVSP